MLKFKGLSPKNIVIVVLIGIAVFSAYKYVITLREKYVLMANLAEKKLQIESLEKQKQNLLVALEKEQLQAQKLTQEKSELKENLKASRKRLSKLFSQVAQNEKATDTLNTQVALLKKENSALLEEKESLSADNQALNMKLSSIIELKKALSELKKQARKVGIEMIHKAQSDKTTEGNQGYLIKEGKPTVAPKKIKIEVTPAVQSTQSK